MLKSYIFKPTELPQKYRSQITDIIKDVVDSKTDSYWKNYTDREFNLDEQTAISINCDGDDVKIIGIMQHIEPAGIHSGDSYAVLPPYNLGDFIIQQIEEHTKVIAKALDWFF